MNQRDIRTRVFTHHFGIKLTAIAQLNLNHVGVIDHVVVGHDIAFRRVNYHPGTQGHKFLLLLRASAAVTAIRTCALTEWGALER